VVEAGAEVEEDVGRIEAIKKRKSSIIASKLEFSTFPFKFFFL